MTSENPADEEMRLVKDFAHRIVDSGLETAAIAFLMSIYPLTYIGSQLAAVFLWPFLGAFGHYGEKAEEIIDFFGERKNVKQLIDEIEALVEQRKTTNTDN